MVPQQINLSSIEKIRRNAENKQTFDLSGKIEIEGKTRQNAENKQTILFTMEIGNINTTHPLWLFTSFFKIFNFQLHAGYFVLKINMLSIFRCIEA